MIFCLLYVFMLYSNCMMKYVSLVRLGDELITIALLALVLLKNLAGWYRMRRRLNKYDVRLLFLLVLLLMIGALSTLCYRGSHSLPGVVKDILMVSKFFICYICGKLLFPRTSKEEVLTQIRKIAKVSITIIFLCGIISIFKNIGMGSQMRFGLRSYQFLFSHYTFLVFAEVILVSTIIARKERHNDIYIAMGMCTLLLTLRTKAVVFCLGYLLFWAADKFEKDIKLKYYMIAGAVCGLAASGKISEYLSYGFHYNMRNGLYAVGIQIALEYFPLGSGFCTFGSNLAYEYNRELFNAYHMNTMQGFELGKPVISDVFWPQVYGEFGALGMVVYLLMLVMIFYSLKSIQEYSKDQFMAVNLIFFYLLTASLAEAVFTNESGTYSAVLMSVYFGGEQVSLVSRRRSRFGKYTKLPIVSF